MAIVSDFNIEEKLSLDMAVLVSRNRINALGSQELTLDYNNITSAIKEDCVDWLEVNRLSLENPHFSFKTYEGIYNCVSITYNENIKKIRQLFKIDSSLGNLDGSTGTMLGTGDDSRISAGTNIERAYYWKIVDPSLVILPSSAPNGEIYTKTANDNGDGTYDVTVQKEVAINLSATSSVQAGPDDNDDYPGGYVETSEDNTNDTEQSFVADGGFITDAVVGEIKRIDNTPLENGKFKTVVTTRTAIAQRVPPESESGGPNYPWFEYGSDYIQDANNIIIGRNQPWSKVVADRDRTNITPAIFKINSMTVRVNDYGLFDYTIVSNTPG